MTEFSQFHLHQSILKALGEEGYQHPTPIQQAAIPQLLEGKDLLGIAQTGTGKTAAFSLPILDHLSRSKHKAWPGNARVLILAPTRELASQIYDNVKVYGRHLSLKTAVIFGGVNQNPQVRALKPGVDVLIATPGRLKDLMGQGHIRLDKVEFFVLDEADRMLDMGFINDINAIVATLPKERQNMLFSATMPTGINKLAHNLLHNPVKVEVTPPASTVDLIDQAVAFVSKSKKTELLCELLDEEEYDQMLIFSKTKHGANRLVRELESRRVTAEAIHSNKSQSVRTKTLERFRSGKLKILVATDIAARGIDVAGVSHVINYDLPMEPESYVHRIGRTARAGREGTAISFCDISERPLLDAIERTIGKRMPMIEV